MTSPASTLDAVIVGAGLAGLRSACELRDLDITVLEAAARSGGRIATDYHDDVPVDMGAVLPYRADLAPPGLRPSPARGGHDEIGLFLGGALYRGRGPAECLERAGFGSGLTGLITQGRFQDMPPRFRQAATAFFQRIHGGDMEDYLPERWPDALATYSAGARAGGNDELVAGYRRHVGHVVRTGAQALSVDTERDGRWRVVYTFGGARRVLHARSVIVATSGVAARRLLPWAEGQCGRFLRSLRYEPATVVAIGARREPPDRCAYVCTPDLCSSLVLRRRLGDLPGSLFLVYFMGAKAKHAGEREQDAVAAALRVLGTLGTALSPARDVSFRAVRHWPAASTVISAKSYRPWSDSCWRPAPGVVLAGDYVHVDRRDPLPYGMRAADQSGRRAALAVRQWIGGGRADGQ